MQITFEAIILFITYVFVTISITDSLNSIEEQHKDDVKNISHNTSFMFFIATPISGSLAITYYIFKSSIYATKDGSSWLSTLEIIWPKIAISAFGTFGAGMFFSAIIFFIFDKKEKSPTDYFKKHLKSGKTAYYARLGFQIIGLFLFFLAVTDFTSALTR